MRQTNRVTADTAISGKGSGKAAARRNVIIFSQRNAWHRQMSQIILRHRNFCKNSNDGCQGCPYGRHSPCIGYCMKKILREMGEKKQSAGKEGERLAGRGK